MLKHFMRRVLAPAALVALALGGAAALAQDQEPSVVYLYSSGDTNITDWLQNTIIPAFEAANPQYRVQFTNSRAAGDGPFVERAIAAMATGDDPLVDVMDLDPRDFTTAVDAGLWYMPSDDEVPNQANIIDAARTTDMALAYRGSQVLVAYNSDVVAAEDVPTTYPELVEWIKANPGQFVYCRPDRGGSGGAMVNRALLEVSGNDPALWQGDFDQALVDQYYPAAYDLLREIHPFIYGEGSYPAGNNPVLELFADGEVSMITAWSDMAIQGINRGFLPESTRLIQFTDLPFPGGYTHLSVPKNAHNLEGALAFVNFMLSPEGQASVVTQIGGFPSVSWSLLPADVQEQFNSVITENVPVWPGGEYGQRLVEGWYEQVATNIDPNS